MNHPAIFDELDQAIHEAVQAGAVEDDIVAASVFTT